MSDAWQLTSATSSWGNETRTYDGNTLQLTRIQADLLDLGYAYPAAGSNNGRISAEINNLTNTQVSYTYDQVNRLATAVSATGGTTNWGLSFSYDVYGNRTAQTVTAGSAPAFSATFGSNNRMVGYSYDNNGNQLTTPDGATLEYDPDNRLTKWTKQGQVDQYQYHPSGWRLSKGSEKYLYGPGGQLLESYRGWNDITDYVYFGGRLLYTLSAGQAVTRIYSDRLGSTRTTETIEPFGGGWTTRNYYPFGEEIGSTANDQYKFASTYRDSATGLDYAVNRYYASGTGRFITADPDKNSARLGSPASWNQYAYSHGDPVNLADPGGLDPCTWDPSTNTLTCKIGSPGGGGGGGGGGNDGMEVVGGDPGGGEVTAAGGGASPAAAIIRISNFSTASMEAIGVQNALRWVRAGIEQDEDCGAWLKSYGTVVATVLGEGPGSTTVYAGVGNFSGPTVNAVAGVGGTDLARGSALLTVNLQGSFFSSSATTDSGRIAGATDEARAFILLHELAHLTEASGFQSSDRAADVQRANNDLVHQHCQRTLDRFAGRLQ